ncbi:hypothetical protein RchiOBHm_Chr6g0258331 [Rosa chinensis]|uniref:Uncharacterized protein n=1 Tax=Rosa chinensis TaxID=74649 RepID=A0A2P6PMM3_ROSCH|nr:hypothetical protein RchiOBHm_Chr6g0258331 [Rosa chinensis]
MVMVHPFFGGSAVDDEMWLYMCPENGGVQDRRLRPPAEDLAELGCERVLIFFCGEGSSERGRAVVLR